MINITDIKTYNFCPLSLYYEYNLENYKKNIELTYNEIKRLKIDIQDLLQKNIRKISLEMTVEEIESKLESGIFEYIKNNIKDLNKTNSLIPEEEFKKIEKDLITETKFSIKILSLKSKKAMEVLQKDGLNIVEMFFPNCIYSYMIKDNDIEIIGVCDKIEIVDGRYYPISIKNSKPPLKGVWDNDAIELVTNALLIEQEFDTEVFVGFIDYVKIGERRPVVMDVKLRKSLFKILNDIKEIIFNKKIPKMTFNKNKCGNCEFEPVCIDAEKY